MQQQGPWGPAHVQSRGYHQSAPSRHIPRPLSPQSVCATVSPAVSRLLVQWPLSLKSRDPFVWWVGGGKDPTPNEVSQVRVDPPVGPTSSDLCSAQRNYLQIPGTGSELMVLRDFHIWEG